MSSLADEGYSYTGGTTEEASSMFSRIIANYIPGYQLFLDFIDLNIKYILYIYYISILSFLSSEYLIN